jgi:hypothetical protein
MLRVSVICRQIAATADLVDTSLMAIALAVTDSHGTRSQVESLPGAIRSDRSYPRTKPCDASLSPQSTARWNCPGATTLAWAP